MQKAATPTPQTAKRTKQKRANSQVASFNLLSLALLPLSTVLVGLSNPVLAIVPLSAPASPSLPLPPPPSLPLPSTPSSNANLPVVLVPGILPSRSSASAAVGLSYRVVVQTTIPAQQQQVRAIAPGAFRATIDGQAMMQAGLFRDRATAEALQQQLLSHNLPAKILTVSGGNAIPGQPSVPATKLAISRFDLPEPAGNLQGRAYSLWATYYYLHQAQAITLGNPLLDLSGKPLGAELSNRDWCAGALQGSVVVMDGEKLLGTYNFVGRGTTQQVDCSVYYPRLPTVQETNKVRFKRSNTPFGEGVSGFMLVPYRTIAVDRKLIPIGSVVYIAEARGQRITLPSGATAVHDGYFYAADVGKAIQGNHIDIFLGPSRQNPFPFVRSTADHTFRAVLIHDPQIQRTLESLHRPGNSTANVWQK